MKNLLIVANKQDICSRNINIDAIWVWAENTVNSGVLLHLHHQTLQFFGEPPVPTVIWIYPDIGCCHLIRSPNIDSDSPPTLPWTRVHTNMVANGFGREIYRRWLSDDSLLHFKAATVYLCRQGSYLLIISYHFLCASRAFCRIWLKCHFSPFRAFKLFNGKFLSRPREWNPKRLPENVQELLKAQNLQLLKISKWIHLGQFLWCLVGSSGFGNWHVVSWSQLASSQHCISTT